MSVTTSQIDLNKKRRKEKENQKHKASTGKAEDELRHVVKKVNHYVLENISSCCMYSIFSDTSVKLTICEKLN